MFENLMPWIRLTQNKFGLLSKSCLIIHGHGNFLWHMLDNIKIPFEVIDEIRIGNILNEIWYIRLLFLLFYLPMP